MWEDTELVTLGLETAITSFSASVGGSRKLLFFFLSFISWFSSLWEMWRGSELPAGEGVHPGCSAEKTLGEFFLPVFLFQDVSYQIRD